jgi:hypothetical protein
MDYTSNYQFFVGVCVKDLKLIKYHNKEAKGKKKN